MFACSNLHDQGRGATQPPSSSSPPPHPSLPPASAPPIADASGVDHMLVYPPFDSSVTAPPTATHSADRRPFPKTPHPSEILKCPRCDSIDTKFCYYNNYSLTQPRYFCKNCKRYWTAGGALRNVPVGGGLRKNKRSKLKLAVAADADAALAAQALSAAGMQHQYQANTPIPVGRAAPAETLQKFEERASATVSSGSLYAHSNRGISPVLADPSAASSHYHGSREMLDQNCGTMSTNHEQAENPYRQNEQGEDNFYVEAAGHVPQFYSSYAATLPNAEHDFPPTAAASGAAVPPGFMGNFAFLQANTNANVMPDGLNANEGYRGRPMVASSGGEVKQEKDGEAACPYDWQLVPEGGLFNGAGPIDGNFFYLPSSGWPDFSQFNDTGPG